ncbi:MAG: SulP family inorganic anion transporter, partial [Candidatus Limivicinus sp.]
AMPAVMVGSLLAEFGIAAESEAAMQLVPLVSVLTALWFLVFYLLKAGRIVKYISTPVMGGFISGVGLTIILMQVPKLFGGTAGTGALFALLAHIAQQLPSFHLLSAVLGFGTFAVILVCKRLIPKVPMAVIMMLVGAVLQAVFHLDAYGVKMLSAAAPGLPHLMLPGFSYLGTYGKDLVIESLSIAAVVMAQTLLASGSYAMKYGDKLDNNQELLAYSAMNLASGFTGCCPINGSVSRSGIADSFGCRSQLMSVSACGTMLLVLLAGTPLLKYLPVPILTGIVMTALWGILDFRLAKKLYRTSRNELFVFLIAFLGVLIFGTVYGVMIGVVLSFFEVAISAVAPPASYMGVIPGQDSFYPLERNRNARSLRDAVIYRFSGNLFFANIDRFQSDIEKAITADTQAVIVDARGVGSIDLTAAERLMILNRNLRQRGIQFYLTEHDGSLNDQLKKLDAGSLLREGAVRRTITLALEDAGIRQPYILENSGVSAETERLESRMEQFVEFEWLFGSEADSVMEQLANESMHLILESENALSAEEQVLQSKRGNSSWHLMAPGDEERFLDHLEMR